MKANEAPEKIILSADRDTQIINDEWVINDYTNNIKIEYTRTDAFVEKAEKYLKSQFIKDVSVIAGTHLIDKDALVAELERIEQETNYEPFTGEVLGKRDACKRLHSFIDTLEVKEVDLDALGILAEHLLACDAHGVSPKYRDGELDLLEELKNNKAQKGE